MGKFRIEILDKDFPYEEITELLHAAYKEHLDAGRNYKAATQTIEDTKQRLEGRFCVVAYDENNKLVGSVAFKIIERKPEEIHKWYEDGSAVYIEQMAVHPDYRDTNVMALMAIKGMKNEMAKKVGSWCSDTSVKAEHLVKAYVKMGFQIVDVVSWETTNYYSYVFRRPIKGTKYSDEFVKRKLFWANLKCRLKYTENGKKRF